MWGDIRVEPKRKNRFLLRINNIPVFVIKTASLPKMTVAEHKAEFISHTFKYPGKAVWQDISVTMVDCVNPNIAGQLVNIIQTAGYDFPGNGAPVIAPGNPYVTSFSKALFNTATGQVTIQSLDAQGAPIDQWVLWNAWVKDFSTGDLTMDSADLLELKVTFTYDWAQYQRLINLP